MKKFLTITLLPILLVSCIVLSTQKKALTNNTDIDVLNGIRITVNEAPRLLGSNSTTIVLFEISKNKLVDNHLIFKNEYPWNTINNIKLNNGKYKLVTYYLYFGKNRLKTETIIEVNNNRPDVEIEYPLFITGEAKLKLNGIKIDK